MENNNILLAVLLAIASAMLGFVIALLTGRKKLDSVTQERTSFATRLEIAQQEVDSLRDSLEFARGERTQLHERLVITEAKREILEKELEQTQEKLRTEFKNTATNIFEDFSNKFTVQSEKKIGDLLNPLRDRLGEFQKKIDDSFATQGKEQYSLKTEIERIVLQTDGLTKALRGDKKAQGNWGEVMLERILEQSGLRKGEEYTVQATGLGLTNDSGASLRPDVIVNLPNDKHIIIDSKVSLLAYERYYNETDENQRHTQVKEFIKSIKAHVNGLEQKRYQDIDKLGTPDFVMMFLPIEGAYSLAMQVDNELHRYAWDRNIVLVCPSLLFAMLRTISLIWHRERGNMYALEITKQAGTLYDKFSGFIKDMEKISTHIRRLDETYEEANKKLTHGRNNILDQMNKLKELGARATKSLPKSREAGLDEDVEELLEN
jgi:DNA recombination protein RmuC